jgi:hypothetical protein
MKCPYEFNMIQTSSYTECKICFFPVDMCSDIIILVDRLDWKGNIIVYSSLIMEVINGGYHN